MNESPKIDCWFCKAKIKETDKKCSECDNWNKSYKAPPKAYFDQTKNKNVITVSESKPLKTVFNFSLGILILGSGVFFGNKVYKNYFVKKPKISKKKDSKSIVVKIPKQAEIYYKKGKKEYSSKNYETAIENFKKAINIAPSFEKAYERLSRTYVKLKNLPKAIETYKKIISIKPDSVISYKNLGVLYLSEKSYEEALVNFEKLIEFLPNEGELYYHIAKVNAYLNNDLEVIENLKKTFSLKGKYRAVAKIDPAFDFIRENPDFIELVK